jgi:FixJ family two-component response regulator
MVPILIVDDAQEDLVFAQRVLLANNILNPVDLLSSGQACLDYFMGKGRIPTRLPCILLLDMVMKPLSGLDVLRKLQTLPSACGSILIMLSGLTDTKMIAEGYRAGASTFLFKPMVAGEFTQMIEAVRGLALKRTPQGTILSLSGQSTLARPRTLEQRPPSSL